MELASLREDLNRTRRQIADVSSLIGRRRVVLAELIVERRDVAAARETLAAMETFLAYLTKRRNQLEQQLSDIEQRMAEVRQAL